MHSEDFVDQLIEELRVGRNAQTPATITANKGVIFSDFVIKHWLNFAVYYERAAVSFIGGWLKSVEEEDVLHYLTRQIEDECNHFRWLKKHLYDYGGDPDNFTAPKEWVFLMDYYANLPSLVERLAAHNIAAETGALGFLEFGLESFPTEIKETATKVIKDERYHVAFGSKMLRKYCTTKKDQELARRSALESLGHMERAREVFINF